MEAAEQVDAADGAQLPTGWAVAAINVDAVQREDRVLWVAKMTLRGFWKDVLSLFFVFLTT